MQRPAPSADDGAASMLRRLLATDGSAAHRHVDCLASRRAGARDLGDALHALCAVHGHHPDLLTVAAGLATGTAERAWLLAAADAFGAERATLARLVAAAGPLPSTPGQAITEAALSHERHALEMLARSERGGVALGAAAALVGDWAAIRPVLARAADHFGVAIAGSTLPDVDTLPAAAAALERAIAFGAQQLLAQHRGLWGILEARASARLHG